MPSKIFSVFAIALFGHITFAQTNTAPVTGTLGNATVVENNPPGVLYTATLPNSSFFNPDDPRGNIKGSVSGISSPDGIGVDFQVTFSNLPTSGGPFLYHIHSTPVPTDGNCTGTLGHLDPFIRGETPACNNSLPQTCQVGDLSGKYGKIASDPFQASFTDSFASTVDGIGAFFGNRSLTIHFANTTRITCANFTLESGARTNSSINSTATATSSGAPLQQTASGAVRPVPDIVSRAIFVLVGGAALPYLLN